MSETKIVINTKVMEADHFDNQKEFLQVLAKQGLPLFGIELRYEYFPKDATCRHLQMERIATIAKENNWQVRLSYPAPLFSNTGLSGDIKDLVEECKILGAVAVKIDTGDIDGITKVDKKVLADFPVQFTVENGQSERTGSLTSINHVLNLIEKFELPIGFTYDVGNWMVQKEDLAESFAATKDKITNIHLKVMDDKNHEMLLKDVTIPFEKYLAKTAPISIEYPVSLEELPNEMAILNKKLS